MAIAKALSKAAKSTGKFLKKKGRQAVRATQKARYKARPALQKAQDVTTKAGTKIKLGAKKVSESKAAKATIAKAKKAKAKIAAKTPESVKKQFRSQEGTVGEKANLRTRATALGKAAAGAAALPGNIAGAAAGPTIGRGVRAAKKKFGGKFFKGKDAVDKMDEFADAPETAKFVRGVLDVEKYGEIGGRISQGAALLAAGGLTASIIKSSTPKDSEYNISRLRDGRFSTQFKDKNANVVFSAKQLNSKEVDDVRTQLAILDSIVLSDNPKARRSEFIQVATYLADEYKISNITGNNLSLIIPNVEGGVQTRRRV